MEALVIRLAIYVCCGQANESTDRQEEESTFNQPQEAASERMTQ